MRSRRHGSGRRDRRRTAHLGPIRPAVERRTTTPAGATQKGPLCSHPMPDEGAAVLDRRQAIEYWERRHAERDEWSSGGDIGISVQANRAFYARRLGRLLEIIDMVGDRDAPACVLDAGCGRGIISRALAGCGFAVTGVDASSSAVEQARSKGGDPSYVVSALDEFWLPNLFDFVVVIDVLFHLTDDKTFLQSLRRVAAHVRSCGELIVTDTPEDRRIVLGDYIVHRPQSEYESVLQPLQFVHRKFVPYAFPGNDLGFHVYQRESRASS